MINFGRIIESYETQNYVSFKKRYESREDTVYISNKKSVFDDGILKFNYYYTVNIIDFDEVFTSEDNENQYNIAILMVLPPNQVDPELLRNVSMLFEKNIDDLTLVDMAMYHSTSFVLEADAAKDGVELEQVKEEAFKAVPLINNNGIEKYLSNLVIREELSNALGVDIKQVDESLSI